MPSHTSSYLEAGFTKVLSLGLDLKIRLFSLTQAKSVVLDRLL